MSLRRSFDSRSVIHHVCAIPFFDLHSGAGDVVQTEPKGWSEAMGLGEHELAGWEGPSKAEVSRDVAVEVNICTRENKETRGLSPLQCPGRPVVL